MCGGWRRTATSERASSRGKLSKAAGAPGKGWLSEWVAYELGIVRRRWLTTTSERAGPWGREHGPLMVGREAVEGRGCVGAGGALQQVSTAQHSMALGTAWQSAAEHGLGPWAPGPAKLSPMWGPCGAPGCRIPEGGGSLLGEAASPAGLGCCGGAAKTCRLEGGRRGKGLR